MDAGGCPGRCHESDIRKAARLLEVSFQDIQGDLAGLVNPIMFCLFVLAVPKKPGPTVVKPQRNKGPGKTRSNMLTFVVVNICIMPPD